MKRNKKLISNKSRLVRLFCLSTVLSVTISCGNSTQNSSDPNAKTDTTLVSTQVIKSVKCEYDSVTSYALYTPPQMKNGSLPLMFFLDPHAKGAQVVEKFKTLADKYGFVLAASNNCKNGMAYEACERFIENSLNDISRRLPVFKGNLAMCGFSGGARNAILFSSKHKGVANVIACSAGIPQNFDIENKNLFYIGVAGTKDLNMQEILMSQDLCLRSNLKNIALLFDGAHEWPTYNTMNEAFLAARLHLATLGKVDVPKSDLSDFLKMNNSKIDSLKKLKLNYSACSIEQNLVHMLNGVESTNSYLKDIELLRGSADFENEQKENSRFLSQENKLKEAYQNIFSQKSTEWWATEIKKLSEKMEQSTVVNEKNMFLRVKGFLSLMAYMYVDNFLKSDDIKAASHFVEIYRLIDPERNEVYYFDALIQMKNNNTTAAEKLLTKALELGFSDVEKLKAEPAFIPLLKQAAIQQKVDSLLKF